MDRTENLKLGMGVIDVANDSLTKEYLQIRKILGFGSVRIVLNLLQFGFG